MLVDISEQKRMHHSAQRLSAIVESSNDAIISKDLNGIIQTWNKAAERMFGYGADEIVGKSILTLIPSDRHGEETLILSKIGKGERIEHYETVRRRRNGEPLDVSINRIAAARDTDGTVVGASIKSLGTLRNGSAPKAGYRCLNRWQMKSMGPGSEP